MTQRLLAIDTSSEACSVALSHGDKLIERFTDQPRKHAELVLPMVDELLAEADITLQQLDAVAFGCGPGSFTGLRIAAGTVQGLAYGADLPVVPISSLAVLAHRAFREKGWQMCHVAIDARMGEVYWGSYQVEHGNAQLQGQECVCKPEHLAQASLMTNFDRSYGVGSGWGYRDVLECTTGPLIGCDETLLPHAKDVLLLAQARLIRAEKNSEQVTVAPHQVAPVYLRNNVADKPGTKKQ